MDICIVKKYEVHFALAENFKPEFSLLVPGFKHLVTMSPANLNPQALKKFKN